eukprot:11977919-Ditylum_brightwellii.AAC.1
MTDGCGLISRDGIDFVWCSYKKYIQARESEYVQWNEKSGGDCQESSDDESLEDDVCPYTSFQGRIGGFKGMWVLDERLGDGIK